MEGFCFLFGHSDCPEKCYLDIEAAIEKCIVQDNCQTFLVGHRGGFDAMATKALQRMKVKFPHIVVHRLLAYYNPFAPIDNLPLGFDGTYYPEEMASVPKRFAIVKANQVMVAQCSYVICYVAHDFTNTYKLLAKAKRRKIPVVNIGTYVITPG